MFIWSSIAHLIALTSPGPDTAVTIRQVSLYGRNAGIFTAIGIGVGIYDSLFSCHKWYFSIYFRK
jgi:threonine/homoserine/homoserine lactone efflux protein